MRSGRRARRRRDHTPQLAAAHAARLLRRDLRRHRRGARLSATDVAGDSAAPRSPASGDTRRTPAARLPRVHDCARAPPPPVCPRRQPLRLPYDLRVPRAAAAVPLEALLMATRRPTGASAGFDPLVTSGSLHRAALPCPCVLTQTSPNPCAPQLAHSGAKRQPAVAAFDAAIFVVGACAFAYFTATAIESALHEAPTESAL